MSNNTSPISQHTLERFEALKARLAQLGSVAVAYSGGVDSTFLTAVAHEVLGDAMLAVTSAGRAAPQRDIRRTQEFCKERGIQQVVVAFDELSIPQFAANTPDRCYHCKRALFTHMADAAHARGIKHLVDGSNKDDEGDYRPGMRALAELEIGSPLREVGMTKQEIRALSHAMGLPTWNMPSAACLASRFAYGDAISAEKLERVEHAEDYLRSLGLDQLRVRVHGSDAELARIEIPTAHIAELAGEEVRVPLIQQFHKLGFTYVSLDLEGFRSGAMNEVL